MQFEDTITRRSYTWPIADVTKQILNNELHVVGASDSKDAVTADASSFLTSIDSLPAKYKEKLLFRVRIIKWIKKNGASRGQRRIIERLLKKFPIKESDTQPLPTSSTAMSWIRDWDESGGNVAAVVTKNFQRKRLKKYSERVEAEIDKVLLKNYFIRTRPSLQNAAIILRRNLENLAQKGVITAEDTVVSSSTLRRRVNEVDPYYRDVHRFGASYAKNKWRYSLAGTHAVRALQRLEVDHTILDFVVVADSTGMPLGRPVITIIVDAFSGYLVGFYISFSGAGLAAVLNAMKVGLMPKTAFTCNAPFLTQEWFGYGVGELYVVDNGLEFHSIQFVSAALEINTDIQYCPVRQPWFKPGVERFFGELGHHLPPQGKVVKPVANCIPMDPRESARITFSDLCKGLLQFFIDVHPLKVHSRTLARPIDLFRESFEQIPPPLLPTNLEKLGLIAAHQKILTVGNEGIVMPGLRFNSHELQAERRKLAPSFKTSVKYDPENLGFAYVQHPKSLEWLHVPNCHPEYADNLSMIQHKAVRAHMKQMAIDKGHYDAYFTAKANLIDKWQSLARGQKLTRDTKSAIQFAGLSSTKSLQGGELPAPQTQLISKKEITHDDLIIPQFEAFVLD